MGLFSRKDGSIPCRVSILDYFIVPDLLDKSSQSQIQDFDLTFSFKLTLTFFVEVPKDFLHIYGLLGPLFISKIAFKKN